MREFAPTPEPGQRHYAWCKCIICYRLRRLRRELNAKWDGIPRPNVKDHGTLNAYTNKYCRCQPCKDAAREYRERKKREAGQ